MTYVAMLGAPASGKSTITAALTELSPRYVLFQKLKVGEGRTDGYRMCTEEEAERLTRNGLVIQESLRYGNRYIVDKPYLDTLLMSRKVPILHMGGIRDLQILVTALLDDVCVALLRCPLDEARQRLKERGSSPVDLAKRLDAWRVFETELSENDSLRPDIIVDTAVLKPAEAARRIDDTLSGRLRRNP